MGCANEADGVRETWKAVALGRDARFLAWMEAALGDSVRPAADIDHAIRELDDGGGDLLFVHLPALEIDAARAFDLLSRAAPMVPLIAVDGADAESRTADDLEMHIAGMAARLRPEAPAVSVQALVQSLARRFVTLRRDVERNQLRSRQLVEYQKWSARSVERLHEWVHELRTPLGVIKGFSANLKDGVYGKLEDSQQQIISRVLNAGELLSQLVTQVRDDLPSPPKVDVVVEESRQQQRSKLSLQSVCEEVLGFFESKAATRGVHLRLEASPCPEVWGDRMRLTQALLNLVKNALRFTPGGGEVVLRVGECEATTSSGFPRCAISVIDTGSGISPENLARVLEEGWTTDPAVGHQGMGLSVAQKVVKEHAGELKLESTPGQGTCVRLSFPLDPRRRTKRSKVRVIRQSGLATELLYALQSRGGDVAAIDTPEQMQNYIEQISSSLEDVTLLATDEALDQQVDRLFNSLAKI